MGNVLKIPVIGGTYIRSDGEQVVVCGLAYGSEGNLEVEYETADEMVTCVDLGVWLGVDREMEFPYPRRFVLDESDGTEEGDDTDDGPTDSEKVRVLRPVVEKAAGPVPYNLTDKRPPEDD